VAIPEEEIRTKPQQRAGWLDSVKSIRRAAGFEEKEYDDE